MFNMKKIQHFMSKPVYGNDGFHILLADAVKIDKYLQRIMRGRKGGFFRRAIPPFTISQLANDMHLAFESMPIHDAKRICQPDILSQFGIDVREDGYIK